ncbi:hypothetical protein PFNF135_02837 [Plasmodium falciparum NF135/5.C10]|uniref:Uncharacterized protein n=1 Tax=Plasmodium falciparum NF135/5.C10 TaxID=1036726 RepID=W4IGI8_PLAFA|nr:hypothetical protein PFNF135_02837 [Plasmodium falciparum NF135/5.C10]
MNINVTITMCLFLKSTYLKNFYYNVILQLISYVLFIHRNLNYSISLSGMFRKSLYCIRAIIINIIFY